jgi:hypothetical protein
MEPEGPARVERRLAAVLAADVRRSASGRGVNGDTDREWRLSTEAVACLRCLQGRLWGA